MSKALFKNINEAKNKFKITDFPEGSKILFIDGEEWQVVSKGMRGSGSWRKSDEITIKPFNKVAKDKNVSLAIDVSLEYLNTNVKSITESVNESMSFEEIKNKFEENPYGIGAQLVVYEEGKNGNPDRLIFKHDEKHRRDQIESRLKTLGIPSKKMSKSTADKAFKYRYELYLYESEVNEGRSQIKRKYGEHGAIRVNSEAPVRNSILEFVGKRFVTRAELDSHLTQLSEDRGKAVDQNAWFKRNERYFESFSNRGSEVWTLSKYGKRVLENITKAKQEKQEKSMIKESIGLFKFDSVNESIDVKYWADYNTDTSGQGKKEHEVKSKKFDKNFFNDAMNYWNSEADGSENMLRPFSPAYSKIYKMAEEFFKKAGWISSNVIQAMIAQES
jgi:hypothetical protein